MITEAVKNYIDKAVLCWLATCDENGTPNVSPKEMFTYFNDTTLLIANLASPNSIGNIQSNPHVCVSFVDIFVQKGYKLKGTATIITKSNATFESKLTLFTSLFTDKFPVKSIIEIKITQVDTIQAPSYFLFPGTKEETQIENAMITYGVEPI